MGQSRLRGARGRFGSLRCGRVSGRTRMNDKNGNALFPFRCKCDFTRLGRLMGNLKGELLPVSSSLSSSWSYLGTCIGCMCARDMRLRSFFALLGELGGLPDVCAVSSAPRCDAASELLTRERELVFGCWWTWECP